jgi:amino acid transporter
VIVPAINTGFFMILILTTTLYAVMYILMFASGIKLRYKYPDVKRAYKVPGGNFGMWVLASVGLLTMLFVILISFFPPANLAIGSPVFYTLFQVIGLLVFILIPIIIYAFRKPSWKTKNQKP